MGKQKNKLYLNSEYEGDVKSKVNYLEMLEKSQPSLSVARLTTNGDSNTKHARYILKINNQDYKKIEDFNQN